jgi:hypothetical protein
LNNARPVRRCNIFDVYLLLFQGAQKMNCSNCSKYNRGRGTPQCLNCKQYLEFQRDSGKRQTIKYEAVPDIILENLADLRTEDIFAILKTIRLDLSIPVMAYYLLGASQNEIASYAKTSQSVICRKISEGIEQIKQAIKK